MPAIAITLRSSTVPRSPNVPVRAATRQWAASKAWAHRSVPSSLAAVAACLTLLLTALVTGPGVRAAAPASPASAAAHYVTLSGSPGMPELDPANGTIYVPSPVPPGLLPAQCVRKVVDIVNAATCNATDGSGCRVVATAPADGPLGAAVDPTTGTVYVINNPPSGNSTIGLLDGRTCNATVTSGCRRRGGDDRPGPQRLYRCGRRRRGDEDAIRGEPDPRCLCGRHRGLQRRGHDRLHAAPRARERQPRPRPARHRHGD